MKSSPILLILFLFISGSKIHAQYAIDEYYTQSELLYEDHIYKSGIRTVKLHPPGQPLSMPVVSLSNPRLQLSFDDLYEDYVNMAYTIIHCNADWTPSNLLQQEYLTNLQDIYIQEFEYSLNALIPYTNYHILLPTGGSRLTKSGNYLLVVYANDDKDDLVLTRRFMVFEDRVSVGGTVKRPTRTEFFDTHQEVDFTVSHPNYNIQNPFQDLQVVLMQNQRWDNAITTLKPQFVQASQLVYQYDKENVMRGGNEFRFFDIKNLQTLSLNVANIKRDSVFTAFLKTDAPRNNTPYTTWDDINGQYVVRRLDATNSETEADYVYVDFRLNYPQPLESGDLYIFGRASDWKLLQEFRMKYDYDASAYRTRVLLKQGYYNFMYAEYNKSDRSADVTTVEGSHWNTENRYQILVYNREVGDRYDRLVGFGELSSADIF